METPLFRDWFQVVFIEHVKKIEGPKLLILDGHSTHITLEIVSLAKENNTEIVCLPPHSTHVLQPLDVAVFKPLKSEWRKIVEEHNGLSFESINKTVFPKLLKQLVTSGKALLRRHAVAGFESTGIFPINSSLLIDGKDLKLFGGVNNEEEEDEDADEDEEVDDEDTVDENEDAQLSDESQIVITNDSVTFKTQSNTRASSSKQLNRLSSIQQTTQLNFSQEKGRVADKNMIDSVMSEFFASKSKPKECSQPKRKLVTENGSCITSKQATQYLVEEEAAKRIKLISAEEKKKEKLENKQKKEEDTKKQRELRAIRKTNKALKRCSQCEMHLSDDKENKSKWINCFECWAWCCYACLPELFKRASKDIYKCKLCN